MAETAVSNISALEKLVAGNGSERNGSYGAGTISTTKAGGESGTAVMLETGLMLETINPIVQFDIDNSALGNTQQTLRIGSVLGQADTYLFWGQTASAADDAVIVDQFGAGCKAVQGFSELVKSKAVVVTKLKVQMSASDVQLNQNFKYRKLAYDSTLNEIKGNIAWTQQKTDYAQNIREMETMYILDSQYFLEYTILAGKVLSVFLELGASNMVETFKALPKVK